MSTSNEAAAAALAAFARSSSSAFVLTFICSTFKGSSHEQSGGFGILQKAGQQSRGKGGSRQLESRRLRYTHAALGRVTGMALESKGAALLCRKGNHLKEIGICLVEASLVNVVGTQATCHAVSLPLRQNDAWDSQRWARSHLTSFR